jgi:hypothetical protein
MHYRQSWNVEATAQLVPSTIRATCEEWYEEMISSQPLYDAEIASVSALLLEKYPGLLLRHD